MNLYPTLSKLGGADLSLGPATGPVLYAWDEHPEIGTRLQRKFDEAGDVFYFSLWANFG